VITYATSTQASGTNWNSGPLDSARGERPVPYWRHSTSAYATKKPEMPSAASPPHNPTASDSADSGAAHFAPSCRQRRCSAKASSANVPATSALRLAIHAVGIQRASSKVKSTSAAPNSAPVVSRRNTRLPASTNATDQSSECRCHHPGASPNSASSAYTSALDSGRNSTSRSSRSVHQG
jgi:hypothetical protein